MCIIVMKVMLETKICFPLSKIYLFYLIYPLFQNITSHYIGQINSEMSAVDQVLKM